MIMLRHKISFILVLAIFLITGTEAHAQMNRNSTLNARQALVVSAGDLRAPLLSRPSASVELSDGFTASRNLKTIDVRIPGAYMDSLNASSSSPLTLQLAAAAFAKVLKTDSTSVDDTIQRFCTGSNEGKTGSGDSVIFHTFRLSNGHKYKIFVYLNDFNGLMAIISPAP